MFVGFGALVLLSALGLVLMLAALDFQASAQAYVAGESHWSRNVSATVHHLEHYARDGRDADLTAAYEALDGLEGSLEGRRALEQSPLDLQQARDGFLRGGNEPSAIPGLIRVYRYFSWTPHFRRALALWRQTDPDVRRLREIADTLASLEPEDTQARQRLRREVVALGRAMNEQAEKFSSALLAGTAWLKRVLFALAAVGTLAFTLITFWIFYRVMAWLRAGDRRFQATFQQAGIGMAQVGLDGRIMDVNPAFCATLLRGREKLLGLPVDQILRSEDASETLEDNQALLSDKTSSYTTRKRFVRGDGTTIWGKLTAALTRGQDGQPEQFIWIIEDVTDAHQLASQLNYQARHDELTGLFNRREIERRLIGAIDDAHQQRSNHVLCFIDVDQFKIVNDSCGHGAGDQLLRRVGALLESLLRNSDAVGRLGADEFAAILHYTDLEDGREVAEKLRRELSGLVFRWEDRTFHVSVTIGLAEINEHSADVTGVLRAADTACHLAKEMGRDRVHVYEDSDAAIAERHNVLEWLNTIQKALDDDRLVLAAQLIQPLSGTPGLHYEVLVRLRDEQGHEHPPGVFLPAAERYGLITMVDMRVLEMTLKFLSRHPSHLELLGRCHINVSAPSIGSLDFHRFVGRVLERYGIPGNKICFEITETSAMANLSDAWSFFDLVSNQGCCIALDDFGSGMSSFNYLRNLPARILKIDGAFVRDMDTEPRDHAVVRAICDVGKALDKVTVAEFVENERVLEQLREMGVDFAQGFGIHRPCPLEDLVEIGEQRRA